MSPVFRHFATILAVATGCWVAALSALLSLDVVAPTPAPVLLLGALAVLFLPAILIGTWAATAASLTAWPKQRIVLAWVVVSLIGGVFWLAAGTPDSSFGILALSLVMPVIVLTAFWWERRQTPPGTLPD